MIGLAFSAGLGGGDNIGYIIPSEEIDLFLKDVADGKYDGKPALTDGLATFENDVLKGKLNMKRAVGMIVSNVTPGVKDYPLKEWDVIVKIGDKEIDNVGMVPIKDNLRVRFQYLVQKFAKDGKVALTIVRDGKEQVVQVPVAPRHDELIPAMMGKYPDYFIYGPIVFSTATAEFVANLERAGPGYFALFSYIGSPLVTRRGDKEAFPGERLVVVSSPMFPHKMAKGYSSPTLKVVKSVNGTRIKNIRHLVETLRDAQDKYIVFEFDDRGSESIGFDPKEALQATEEIPSPRQQASASSPPTRYGPGSPGTCPAARNASTESDVTDVALPNPASHAPSGFCDALRYSSARWIARSEASASDGRAFAAESCAKALGTATTAINRTAYRMAFVGSAMRTISPSSVWRLRAGS